MSLKKLSYNQEVKARIEHECCFIEVSLTDLRKYIDVTDVTRKNSYQILSNIMDSVTFLNHCFRFL